MILQGLSEDADSIQCSQVVTCRNKESMNHNYLGNITVTIYKNYFWGKETLICQLTSHVVKAI